MQVTIFGDRLAALEADTSVAVVPGDVDAWCAHVLDRVEDVADLWDTRLAGRRELFKVMRRRDPEMHARIDRLERSETELRTTFGSLRDRVHAACMNRTADRVSRARTLRTELMHHVADVRAHDGAVVTWFNEAFYRDRGEPG